MTDILQFEPVLKDGSKARIKRRRLMLGVTKALDVTCHQPLANLAMRTPIPSSSNRPAIVPKPLDR
jgi:hypothetical protein